MRLKTYDLLAVTALLTLTAYVAVRFVNFNIPPFEDAAILMRYAGHLAEGYGVVWNIGEQPVDGATDFLFMVFVSILKYTGTSLEQSTRVISISSHFISILLIYAGMRKVQKSGIIPAFISATYFAIGPGLFLAAAYFGTPFFTLGVISSWILAQNLLFTSNRTIANYAYFSISCLITSLIRPEGALISAFMLMAISMLIPRKNTLLLTEVFSIVFVTLGGIYFIWHWKYFGHPLPNPYYKKGGGQFYLDGLKNSVKASLSLGLPFIPIVLLSIRSRQTLLKGTAFVIPILGSTCMWSLLSNEMNFGARFQYPILALWVLSWFPLIRDIPSEFAILCGRKCTFSIMQKTAALLFISFIIASFFKTQFYNSKGITYYKDGRYDIGVMLERYADRGYTIATTEAGLLPLYSKWRALDTWGLNDEWIAHSGKLTLSYLHEKRPDIIVWHSDFSPCHPPSTKSDSDLWSDQVMTLKQYAEQNKFTLAAVFGTRPDDTHYYYVRSDLPESNQIGDSIRSTPYTWFTNGRLSKNYIQEQCVL
ncbi:hypothetical protein HDIA_4296 [Hartmannibacter diazotrophicus]|uniref:Glycosyltransferase RgtA/B/C/D-like domain-containing protein n=1 Tax=Hartmannibacter diazotrophicus TaxID=1482074 RepID=A0A2C9DC06_9HYPH|nr:hypothetical protein [Hartmannibacter diazotrophicus]SON57837.1 hypothetical protein HDIA_4296 [Hartmannibacter diazotrophicus]